MKITTNDLKKSEFMTKMDTLNSNPIKSNEMTLLNSNGNMDFQSVFSNTNNSQFMPKCPLCEKTFANSSNLKHHMNTIHFNEAKWICNECGKVCTSKSNLKVHLRVHLRVKPYYCRWCDYNCMHHSSIRDHLSKCHPDKSHNSCEPGYIFNSTAVPEPELSHFEPSTGMISTNVLEHYDDCNQMMENNSKFSNKKLNKKLNINAINNNKRVFNDFVKEEIVEETEDYQNHYQNNEIDEFKPINTTKKFKPEYNKNSKKHNSKKLREKNLFHESNKCDEQYLHNKDNDLDEHFNENNFNNNNVYYSEDENSIDENLNEDSSVESKSKNHLVTNSSPSSSTSSSMTSDTALSLSPTSSKQKNSHLLMASNLAPPMSNEFFSNLFSNFPSSSSADLHTKFIQESNANSTNQFNNIAAALIQRLSTAALFQQFNANNGTNKSIENTNQMIASLFSNKQQQADNNYIHSSTDNKELSKQPGKSPVAINHEHKTHEFDMKDLKVKVNGCALDLSLKSNNKRPKQSESNETNDEYFSALSPVSTSSTNLSTSSLSSFCNSNNKKHDDKLFINKLSAEQTTQQNKKSGNKAILDVINRLKSKSKLTDESDTAHTSDLPKSDNESRTAADEVKYDCKHNLATQETDTNLEELNDLIKSHLLPISAAVYEKYKNYFVKLNNNNKNSAKSEHDSDEDKETRKDIEDDLEESDFQEISFADKSVSESMDDKTNVDLNSKKCTFCKILKNLIDLHQLLHKT